MYKVSVTVGANGTLHAGRIRRVNLRGTRVCSSAPPSSENILLNELLKVNNLVVLISAACRHLESLLMYNPHYLRHQNFVSSMW